MGRATFDAFLSMAGGWPFGARRVVVLSSRPLSAAPASVERLSGAPRELAAQLEGRGARHVYLDGGRTLQAFLRDGLLDRIVVTHVPVLLGSGIPLFGPLAADVRLRHRGTRAFPDGLVQSVYDVAR